MYQIWHYRWQHSLQHVWATAMSLQTEISTAIVSKLHDLLDPIQKRQLRCTWNSLNGQYSSSEIRICTMVHLSQDYIVCISTNTCSIRIIPNAVQPRQPPELIWAPPPPASFRYLFSRFSFLKCPGIKSIWSVSQIANGDADDIANNVIFWCSLQVPKLTYLSKHSFPFHLLFVYGLGLRLLYFYQYLVHNLLMFDIFIGNKFIYK